ncbi:hypothetical protein AwDysgo_15430 [Bacteroidales bacterium]|nr:hypothetical protein AwDysgo_15430 [Bacteroidales bacterium]
MTPRLLFILLGACFLSSSVAIAQAKFGVKFGASFTSSSLSDSSLDTEGVAGFHVGPTMDLVFASPIGMELSALYSKKGVNIIENESSVKINTSYIDVPANLKLKMGILGLRFFAHAGPCISFKISSDKSLKGNFNNVQDQIKDKRFALSANVGGGMELFSSLQLAINYGIGLSDDYSSQGISSKSKTWSASASFFF